MSESDGMTEIERLVELQAIHRLKGRRDHAVDRKDWATDVDLRAKCQPDDNCGDDLS